VDLICRKSVVETIVKALREKKMLSSQVLGDEWKEWLTEREGMVALFAGSQRNWRPHVPFIDPVTQA
jgi:hypothetical protein